MRAISDDVTRTVVRSLCESINSPKSLGIALLLDAGDDLSFLNQLSIDALSYKSSESFADDYLLVSILSKWVGLKTGVDKESAALEKWKLSEVRCRETNALFRRLSSNSVNSEVGAVLYRAQQKIAETLCLGWASNTPFQSVLIAMLEVGRWGPGATFDLRRSDGPDIKISKSQTVTDSCFKYAAGIIGCDPVWFEAITGFRPDGPCSFIGLRKVGGNRFLTVPKNAKTDRCIAAEPTMNSFIQLGVGSYLRRCLKLRGVDLDDQTVNQRLALAASAENLATLDLSMASDTISRELVRSLLPLDWWLLLDDLRCKASIVKRRSVTLEKFSSMGNGFTFELESLIFWALCSACIEQTESRDILAVFGDDLIVPSEAVALITEVLGVCGFVLNEDKSFSSGPFRESCGKHYFSGIDVTPVYQKKLVTSSAECIRLANRLVRWSLRIYGQWRCSVIRKAHKALLDFYRSHFGAPLPCIPVGVEGDDGFLMPPGYFETARRDKSHGILCDVIVFKPSSLVALDLPMYALKLRNPKRLLSYLRGGAAISKPGLPNKGAYRRKTRWINLHEISGPYYDGFEKIIVDAG